MSILHVVLRQVEAWRQQPGGEGGQQAGARVCRCKEKRQRGMGTAWGETSVLHYILVPILYLVWSTLENRLQNVLKICLSL